MALIDKPTNALGSERPKSIPVVAAVDLKEHREVPAVRDRLARVAELVEARRRERDESASPAA